MTNRYANISIFFFSYLDHILATCLFECFYLLLHLIISINLQKYATKKLGGGLDDIEDLPLVHARHDADDKHFALNPIVKDHANLRPTEIYVRILSLLILFFTPFFFPCFTFKGSSRFHF